MPDPDTSVDPSPPRPDGPTVVVLEPVRDLTREVAAVVLLTVGSLLPLIGWIVGVILLWSSDRWRVWQKALGTLVWPFGYTGVLALVFSPGQLCASDGVTSSCTGTTVPAYAVIPALVLLVGAPLLVGSVLLIVAASRRRIELARRARLLARAA